MAYVVMTTVCMACVCVQGHQAVTEIRGGEGGAELVVSQARVKVIVSDVACVRAWCVQEESALTLRPQPLTQRIIAGGRRAGSSSIDR